jgi:hypothetical protein
MNWRIYTHDGERFDYEQPFTREDGTLKPLSFDDMDLPTIAQLLTVDDTGQVVHVVTFTREDSAVRIPVFRRNNVRVVTVQPSGEVSVVESHGALSGFNQLNPDGTESLMLDLVSPDGTVSSGQGQDIQLRTREVFSTQRKSDIDSHITERLAILDADNHVLENPFIPEEPVSDLAGTPAGGAIAEQPLTPPDADSIQAA